MKRKFSPKEADKKLKPGQKPKRFKRRYGVMARKRSQTENLKLSTKSELSYKITMFHILGDKRLSKILGNPLENPTEEQKHLVEEFKKLSREEVKEQIAQARQKLYSLSL